MTRDEAIGKVFTIGKGSFSLLQATDLVDALIALHLLKQKGLLPMTRDEAIKKVSKQHDDKQIVWSKGGLPQLIVDALIALDLLKVEEQPDAKTAAIQALSMAVVGSGHRAFSLDAAYAFGIVEAIERAGLNIVRKDTLK